MSSTTSEERRDVARLLVLKAQRDSGEDQGLLHRAARLLIEVSAPRHAEPESCCHRCGGQVIQPRTGRRRRYCTTCSPRKASGVPS